MRLIRPLTGAVIALECVEATLVLEDIDVPALPPLPVPLPLPILAPASALPEPLPRDFKTSGCAPSSLIVTTLPLALLFTCVRVPTKTSHRIRIRWERRGKFFGGQRFYGQGRSSVACLRISLVNFALQNWSSEIQDTFSLTLDPRPQTLDPRP